MSRHPLTTPSLVLSAMMIIGLIVVGASTASAQSTAAIEGRVTDQQTGTPVLPAWVSVVDAAGMTLGSAAVDASGNYRVNGLPAGSFSVLTTNEGGYVDQIYDGVPCEPSCSPGTGQGVPTVAGQTTAGIEFRLTLGFTIRGTVSASGTGSPLSGVAVDVFSTGPRRTWTDASGNYRILIEPGTHVARTDNRMGYLDELFDNKACAFLACDPATGTPIIGSAGDVRTASFALDLGGSVAGRVTDQESTQPLANVQVLVYDAGGVLRATAITGADGRYEAIGLPTGTYRARTLNTAGYIDELFDNLQCAGGCTIASGKQIAVVAGLKTSNINFGLLKGGEITGRLTEPGGVGIPNTDVIAYRASDNRPFTGRTNATGVYRIRGLTTDEYAVATDSLAYRNKVWENVPCYSPCTFGDATLVTITRDKVVDGIDFVLTRLASFSGRVTDATTGAGLADIQVAAFDLKGTMVSTGVTDASGQYMVRGLSTGDYFARTFNDKGLINQLYRQMDCVGCNVTLGNRITVFEGSNTSNILFSLRAGGAVSGIVTDAATTAPLANLTVSLYDAAAKKVAQATTQADGSYRFAGLLTGTYYVAVDGSPLGYASELYDDVLCVPSCTITSGTGLAVLEGTEQAGINLGLDKLGSISGAVRDETTNAALKGIPVKVANAAGTVVASTSTDASGAWKVLNLRAGTYYAFTATSGDGYTNEVYDNVKCAGACVPTSGTPILVSPGEAVTGIDITLFRLVVPVCARDVTKKVDISRGGVKFNPSLGQYTQYVEVTNITSDPIGGPLRLVLDNLSANATLANRSGTTSCTSPSGSPYIIIEGNDPLDSNDWGTIVLRFNNPSGSAITYKVRVLAGPNQP